MSHATDIEGALAAASTFLVEHGHHQVGEALALVVAGVDNLADAMGAAPGWRSVARLHARNAALAELARGFGKMSAHKLAERITALIDLYNATSWPADHRAGHRPADRRGAAYDFLTNSAPLSVHTIRKLLGNQSAGEYPREDAA
jgi:hypothetical protein